MQTKTTMDTAIHLLEWLKFKRQTISSTGKNLEEVELCYIAGGNVKWCEHFGNWQFLKKLSTYLVSNQ